jgi:hypothetical protein
MMHNTATRTDARGHVNACARALKLYCSINDEALCVRVPRA